MKTDQVYEELDASKMGDDIMTSNVYENFNARKILDPLNDEVMNKKGYRQLDASKRNDAVIGGEDYEELAVDFKMLDETTNYASLK